MATHVYTITDDNGNAYVGICPWYQWRKVELHFGVPKERIRRGGDLVRGRAWTPEVLPMQCDSCGAGIPDGEESFFMEMAEQ